MAIKRKGVLAVPGEYVYGDVTEIKTADELKLAAERQPIIMLTNGHPIDGIPRAEDVIGTVSQKWNGEKVIGDFWFHDEKISDSIKEKLVNNEPIAISGGILIDDIDEGVQKGIVYTHMAIIDGEDPKCPLGTCGVNIRLESNPAQNKRYEQETKLESPEKEKEVTPEVEEPVEADVVEAEPEPEIPKTEEPATKNVEEEVKELVEEEVTLVPEVIIPTSTDVPKEWEKDESGWITFTPQRKKEK